MNSDIPSFGDIKKAQQRIDKYIYNTPVLTSHSVNDIVGANVFLKCENFQKVGAFKIRGATNVVRSFIPEERSSGFATHSSGNHAQALALAAKTAGSKAYIVMPENSPDVKKNAVIEYGAEVIFCKPTERDRESNCKRVVKETGAIYVPPFDHPGIIAGQATVAKELVEAEPDLDYLITPVGGGGLAAGTALISEYLSPTTKVILAEPENVDDTFRSFKSGERQRVGKKKSIADGLLVSVGELNFEIIKKFVEDVITVSEEEIAYAMRLIWERMKIIIEPSSAVAIAAMIKDKTRLENKNVGIIITGGNVDLNALPF